jgi:hypothetical protein
LSIKPIRKMRVLLLSLFFGVELLCGTLCIALPIAIILVNPGDAVRLGMFNVAQPPLYQIVLVLFLICFMGFCLFSSNILKAREKS